MALEKIGKTMNLSRRNAKGQAPRDPKRQHQSLTKYSSSKKFERDAKWIFRNFNSPIWIVPAWDKGIKPQKARVSILTLDEILPDLLAESALGLTPEEIKKGITPGPDNEGLRAERMRQHLAADGTILIAASTGVAKDFWPSPWMILHAMFDDSPSPFQNNFLLPYVNEVQVFVAKEHGQFNHLLISILKEREGLGWKPQRLSYSADTSIIRSMTMGSARSRPKEDAFELIFRKDISVESIVQSLTHTKNFHFKWEGLDDRISSILSAAGDPLDPRLINKIKESMVAYEALINGMRQEILERLDSFWKGKVIRVNVTDRAYSTFPDVNRGGSA